ncbi:MAG: anaerobic ribonucleoside-triphosphate reductase activating protein [Lachnospiraceae bacterium]|nr:anaerobic ribonucleoside-triphosphate reductase activating protein [Lachnospiraceae bacterium]
MNYSAIKYNDIANGPGVRTVLFVSGCTHHCKGCFQPETWDFAHGEPFTREVEDVILDSLDSAYIEGLTLLGGEPMEPVNQAALVPFIRRFKERFPQKTLWCFSGYTFDADIAPANGKAHTDVTDEFLSMIDVLVDGEFILEQKDITLLFRGSRNQRLIDMKKTLSSGEVTLLPEK